MTTNDAFLLGLAFGIPAGCVLQSWYQRRTDRHNRDAIQFPNRIYQVSPSTVSLSVADDPEAF